MKYFVTLRGEEHVVEIDGRTVTIDGESTNVTLENLPGTPVKLLTVGGRVHRVLVALGASRSSYQLSVAGYRFDAEALNERAKVIRDMAGLSAKAAGPAPLVAPMPGLIVRINVGPGDPVRAGQGLVIMEAMKMENELRASASGTVKSVHVSPGSTVEKGALLVELE